MTGKAAALQLCYIGNIIHVIVLICLVKEIICSYVNVSFRVGISGLAWSGRCSRST